MRTLHLLVLHGPHLDWIGEPSLPELDRALESAVGPSAELKFANGTSEAELVAALHRLRDWPTHVVVSPAALAPTAYVLREALGLMKVPFAEVFVDALPGSAEHAQKSVLRVNAECQLRGKAPAVYIQAAEKLLALKLQRTVATATARQAEKQIGHSPRAAAARQARVAKTIGRVAAPRAVARNVTGISREAVRQQIAARLGGRISASQLATWGREQWLAVEGGAATEAGQRELLEEALQALALSAAGKGISEPELLEWMARMG